MQENQHVFKLRVSLVSALLFELFEYIKDKMEFTLYKKYIFTLSNKDDYSRR